jgi:hypothetical protein
MDKAKILMNVKTKFLRHSWETFVNNPPSMPRGGKGVAVQGCPRCRKPLNTVDQFMEHLANDVLPPIVDLVLTLGKGD